MTKKEENMDIPFDQYSRQYQVSELINSIRKDKKEKFTILDVGGYKGRTADFFPQDSVTVLDVFDIEEDGYVKGDGSNLPFENGSFDFVLNFDVLEHIPEKNRERFILECLRVANKAAIFSAPNKTPENELAEERLNALYKKLHNEDHRWLHEHIKYKLPDFSKVESLIKQEGYQTAKFLSNNTLVWALMQSAIFLNSKFPINAPELVELNSYYNLTQKNDGGRDESEAYRVILYATKNKGDYSKVTKKFRDKNKPLTTSQQLEIISKVFSYNTNLSLKLTQQSKDYQDLHIHELNRANELDKINRELHEKNIALSNTFVKKMRARTKHAIQKARLNPTEGDSTGRRSE